ncbi:penicillinase repressor [Flavobacterium cyanobacteriorum]|uniref:Penicillinase repressor n=1 Tax=Flavobacterium cyanobacteriorum TaxID=2022802 RepID=A0A255ZAM9_9FLAO|nr:BlaI/MecI/CopY family transcriptional regulator [Flavobacterium cyanobacteriorum]OYQ38516.1 penicillinase repressor [Flavobacterium cyanobacteriorum]
MQLTKTEEQLMQFLWKQEKAFMKDLIDMFPDPKPAATTIATLLKRMADKGFVGYKEFGKSREYYPLIEKSAYFSKQMNGMIKSFFNNSTAQFASFFTKETNMTAAELEELKEIIDKEIQKKKK